MDKTGTTPSEQMFFGGAPLAHVVLYYDLQWRKRRTRLREVNKISQHRQLIKCLAERHGTDRALAHFLGNQDTPGSADYRLFAASAQNNREE